jgi:hypothetical protein
MIPLPLQRRRQAVQITECSIKVREVKINICDINSGKGNYVADDSNRTQQVQQYKLTQHNSSSNRYYYYELLDVWQASSQTG